MQTQQKLIRASLKVLLLGVFIVSANACGDADVALPEALEVVLSSPENGSTQVEVDSEFVLEFSDELDLDSLDPGAISLRDKEGEVVTTDKLFTNQNQKIQLVPTLVLQAHSVYFFRVNKGVSGLHQVASLRQFQARFTTR